MIQKIRFYIAILLTSQLFANFSHAQTIAEKYYKEANSPVFVANGFINFSAAQRNQQTSFEQQKLPDGATTNRLHNSQSIGNDSQIFLKSGVMTKDGAKYGAVAKVEFNYNADHRNENPNLDQAFTFAEGDFGKVEFGNNKAVNQQMKVGPTRFARGAGGINGKYLEQVNMPMLANSAQSSSAVCNGGVGSAACSNVKLPRFILLAQSPIGHGGYAKSFYQNATSNPYLSGSFNNSSFNKNHFRALKDDSFDGVEDSTKLSYFSPRINGLQLGASYAPTTNNGVTSNIGRDVDLTSINNIFSFGANYSEDFDNVGVGLSATGEKGQIKNSNSSSGISRQNLFAYDFAATVTYFGFNFGASYGTWGKSLQAKSGIYSCDYNSSQNLSSQNCANNAKKFSDPHYYTLGIGYGFGPINASLTGIKSDFQKNKYEAFSLGLDYKLTKSFMPYFEITKFVFTSNQAQASNVANQGAVSSSQQQIRNNSGYVFLTGILFSF
jgi:hypothetical protein